MTSTRFIEPMYDAVDALDLEGMLRWLTDDATSQLGNGPVVSGKAEIRASFAGFFATLDGMRHQMLAMHVGEKTVVLESLVTYIVRGGESVTVPAATALDVEGDLVRATRVYIDLSPLLALQEQSPQHAAAG